MTPSRSAKALDDAAPLMAQIARAVVRDEPTRRLLEQLYVYLWCSAPREVDAAWIPTILLEVAGPEGKEDIVNAGQQLIAKGRELGREEGLRTAIPGFVAARSIPLSEIGEARVASCTDIAALPAG